MKRAYTRKQLFEMNFPVSDYDFPHGNGTFDGVLVMKKWGDRNVLICYFDTDQGEKLKLCAWFKRDSKKDYRPKHSDLDMSKVEIGTDLRVNYSTRNSGKTLWESAEII